VKTTFWMKVATVGLVSAVAWTEIDARAQVELRYPNCRIEWCQPVLPVDGHLHLPEGQGLSFASTSSLTVAISSVSGMYR
jgi:hypothetical protein